MSHHLFNLVTKSPALGRAYLDLGELLSWRGLRWFDWLCRILTGLICRHGCLHGAKDICLVSVVSADKNCYDRKKLNCNCSPVVSFDGCRLLCCLFSAFGGFCGSFCKHLETLVSFSLCFVTLNLNRRLSCKECIDL